jgi:vacuolar protein sorting-associated protein 1
MLHHENALVDLRKMLAFEKNPLFTQNDHYLITTRNKCYYSYRGIRWRQRYYLLGEHIQDTAFAQDPYFYKPAEITPEAHALQALANLGYRNLKIEDLKRLHPPDGFDEELRVMADVRAYFQVAYKA